MALSLEDAKVAAELCPFRVTKGKHVILCLGGQGESKSHLTQPLELSLFHCFHRHSCWYSRFPLVQASVTVYADTIGSSQRLRFDTM